MFAQHVCRPIAAGSTHKILAGQACLVGPASHSYPKTSATCASFPRGPTVRRFLLPTFLPPARVDGPARLFLDPRW